MLRYALAAALVVALAPPLARAQALGCPMYVGMTDDQRVLVAQGLLSGYLLGATVVREKSLDAVTDPKLGPGLRAASSELGRPLTRLQGKTPREVAEELRAECGKAQWMRSDISVAFAALLSGPASPHPKPK